MLTHACPICIDPVCYLFIIYTVAMVSSYSPDGSTNESYTAVAHLLTCNVAAAAGAFTFCYRDSLIILLLLLLILLTQDDVVGQGNHWLIECPVVHVYVSHRNIPRLKKYLYIVLELLVLTQSPGNQFHSLDSSSIHSSFTEKMHIFLHLVTLILVVRFIF